MKFSKGIFNDFDFLRQFLPQISMRIVAIGDTHGTRHIPMHVPDGDVLLHAGDFTHRGRTSEVEFFNTWLGTLPHKLKYVIAGNHDTICEIWSPEKHQKALPNAIYLCNTSDDSIPGLRICGCPLTPCTPQLWRKMVLWSIERVSFIKRGVQRWGIHLAFMTNRTRKWAENIASDTAILLTHTPPYGVLDVACDPWGNTASNWGDPELLAHIEQNPPLMAVFGHVHDCHGAEMVGNTLMVNASSALRSEEPISIDIEDGHIVSVNQG